MPHRSVASSSDDARVALAGSACIPPPGTAVARMTNAYSAQEETTPARCNLNHGVYLDERLLAALTDDRRRNVTSHITCDKREKFLALEYAKCNWGSRSNEILDHHFFLFENDVGFAMTTSCLSPQLMSKRGRGDEGDREAEVRHAMELIRGVPVAASEAEGLALTPLEKQVVALKESLPPHVILMVACGYRVKFYGRDSRVISRRSGIMCIPGQPFEYSSVPYTRVEHYIRRLVAMGYHVGFADQESAAVRAVEGVKSGVFQRSVSQLYSRGTLLPNEHIATVGGDSASAAAAAEGDGEADGAEDAGQISATDGAGDRWGRDASELFLCFVLAASDDGGEAAPLQVVLVSFVTRRCERFSLTSALALEDVVQRFDIVEIVIVMKAGPPAARRSSSAAGDFMACLPEKYATVLQHTLPLHMGPTTTGEEDGKAVSVCGYVTPRAEAAALDAAITAYLKPYRLHRVYADMTRAAAGPAAAPVGGPAPAAETPAVPDADTLALPGSTLRALDIFHSSTGPTDSLLALLDSSITACGARKLRAWLAAPLASRAAVLERQQAVAFLVKGGDDGRLEDVLRECARIGDVEATIGKLHACRCGVLEYTRLLRMVRTAHAVARELLAGSDPAPMPTAIAALLARLDSNAMAEFVAEHGVEADSTAATPLELFTGKGRGAADTPAAITEQLEARDRATQALEAELEHVRAVLKMPGLEYRTIAGTSYLIDIPAGKADRALKDWTVMTRTKTNVRFHTPAIIEANTALCAARDRLVAAAASAWQEEQRRLSADVRTQSVLADLVGSIASLDALRSLSVASTRPGYVAPTLVDHSGTTAVRIVGGRHPVLDARLSGTYVSCDVSIDEGGTWLLTGPNMGGKSALMRMVGCFAVLAQLGCFVPAVSATLPVFAGVYCRMGSRDSLLEGSSTFLVEMEETSRILRAPRLSRSLVLMDELGRGTSSFDGVAVAAATLEYLVASRATTIFVTHYSYLCDPYMPSAPEVGAEAGEEPAQAARVQCYYMGFREETVEGAGDASERRRLVFTYKPARGVTPSSFGVDIAKMAGLPECVTRQARVLSAEAEKLQTQRMALPLIASFLSNEQ